MWFKINIIAGLFSLPIILAGATNGFTKYYYVAPSGSQTDCTQTTPCSITTGLDRASQPGDEVVLLNGVYSDAFVTQRSGTQANYITIRAHNKHQAIIRPSGSTLANIKNSYLIIRGIHFDAQKKAGTQGGIRFAGNEVSTPPHHVVFEENIVEKTYASGIHITYGQHDIIIRNNFINGTGYGVYWGEGFYIGHKTDSTKTVYNVAIYGNDIRDFTENGVETKLYANNIVVRDNTFRDQVFAVEHGVTPEPGRGNNGTIELGGHSNRVYNNLIYNSKGGMGVFVVKPNAGHKVYNNVIYNSVSPTNSAIKSQNYDLQWPTGTYPPSEIYNNTFYNLVSHDTVSVDSIKLVVRNNIGINLPENLTQGQLSSIHFVNAAEGNFRPTPTSTATDRATKQPYSSVDIEGRAATGAARDFGAYELGVQLPGLPSPSQLQVHVPQ